jgi:hypothetical protein
MTTDLLQTGWTDFDSAELRFILLECIGKPGQYDGCDGNPNTFYLPLAGHSCRIKLTFSDSKQIVAFEPGSRRSMPLSGSRSSRRSKEPDRIRLGATAASAATAWVARGAESDPACRSCHRRRTRR